MAAYAAASVVWAGSVGGMHVVSGVRDPALDWRGVPIFRGRGKTHLVTYADILRDLEPLNEGRDKRDRITYDSLRVHAQRHYDLAGIVAYWRTWMDKEFKDSRRPCGDNGV